MAEIVPLKKYKTANANNAPKRDGMKMIIGVAIFLQKRASIKIKKTVAKMEVFLTSALI